MTRPPPPLLLAAIFSFLSLLSGSSQLTCLTSPCRHGLCALSNNGSYSCYCLDGYTGVHCQTNWDECWSSPCLNGGSCVDLVAAFRCICPPGFTGDRCEENLDECGSDPCFNNATCEDLHNGYMCHCLPGYTGQNCETDLAVCEASGGSRCLNGGLCLEGPGLSFYCHCLPGWTGGLCESETDECASSPCTNGGVCVDMHTTYLCACPQHYTGKNCEKRTEPCSGNPCQNGGVCLFEDDQRVCYCVPDYHGLLCQLKYDECLLGPGCLNGGRCVDGVDSYSCLCPGGFTGRYCECSLGDGKTGLDCDITKLLTTTSTTATITLSTSTMLSETYPSSNTTPVIYTTFSSPTSEMVSSVEPSTFQTYFTSPSTISEVFTSGTSSGETASSMSSVTGSFGTSSGWDTTTHSEVSMPTSVWCSTVHSTVDEWGNQTEGSVTFPTTTHGYTMEISTHESEGWSDMSTGWMPSSTTHSFGTITTELTSGKIPWWWTTEEISTAVSLTESTEYETTSTESSMSPTTGSSSTDMPCLEDTCANGGTCYQDKYGVRCECRFGWRGKFCEEEGGVRTAAFTGSSYLYHLLPSGDKSEALQVALGGVQTLGTKGLLLLARPSPSLHMSLYVEDARLKFLFSCGLQTMLFAELNSSISSGYPAQLTASLEKDRNGSCEGSVRVNGSLWMRGKQDMGGKEEENGHAEGRGEDEERMLGLWLGGAPGHISLSLPVREGFVGCIESLTINKSPRKVYGDAVDGEDVQECTSLACLSSPCNNGATCVELPLPRHNTTRHGWTCRCPSGWSGEKCEKSVCANNPCRFGGTCAPYPGSGFICLCPLGKHGLLCQQDVDISQLEFSPSVEGLSSFAAYPLPATALHQSFELRLRFRPASQEQVALLLYIGEGTNHHSPRSRHADHLALSYIKGYVVLTWNLGSGPRRIFTPEPVKRGGGAERRGHSVRLGRTGQAAWLQVDSMPNITGTSPGPLSQLNTRPLIYLGGYETYNFSGLPHDLPLHSGFSGCLSEVELRSGRVRLALHSARDAFGRNVGQCSVRHCTPTTCHNGGLCIDHPATFTCLCGEGWFGATCGLSYNPCDAERHNCADGSTCVPLEDGYACDCPFAALGPHCEAKGRVKEDEGVSLKGERSFLGVAPALLHEAQACVELEVRPARSEGLVLFTSLGHGFLSLYLHGGLLELRLRTTIRFSGEGGGGIEEEGSGGTGRMVRVRSGRVLALGQWARVRAARYAARIFLWVEGSLSSGTLAPGDILPLSHSPLYIGGAPDLSEVPAEAVPQPAVPFTGCVRRLVVNWRALPLDEEHVLSGRNTHPCEGTACGGDLCLNSGTCFLSQLGKPSCNCPKGYRGERCEIEESCEEIGCENNGRCIEEDGRFICRCLNNWSGPLCTIDKGEDARRRGVLGLGAEEYFELEGRGKGLARTGQPVKRAGGEASPLLSPSSAFIALNFSTPHQDGLLLWTTSQEGDFVGVGLEKGVVKVTWGGLKREDCCITTRLPGPSLADGSFHMLNLSLPQYDSSAHLSVDSLPSQPILVNISHPTQRLYYLGGGPGDKLKEISGAEWSGSLVGCLSGVDFSPEQDFVLHHRMEKVQPLGDAGSNGATQSLCHLFYEGDH